MFDTFDPSENLSIIWDVLLFSPSDTYFSLIKLLVLHASTIDSLTDCDFISRLGAFNPKGHLSLLLMLFIRKSCYDVSLIQTSVWHTLFSKTNYHLYYFRVVVRQSDERRCVFSIVVTFFVCLFLFCFTGDTVPVICEYIKYLFYFLLF